MFRTEVGSGDSVKVHGTLPAEGATGRCLPDGLRIAGSQILSAPMNDGNQPDLIAGTDEGVLRDHCPVTGKKDLVGIEAEVQEKIFSRYLVRIYLSSAFVREDNRDHFLCSPQNWYRYMGILSG